jgi:hypothetical protein
MQQVVTALAEKSHLKRYAPVVDLLALLTASGLGDPPDEVPGYGHRSELRP